MIVIIDNNNNYDIILQLSETHEITIYSPYNINKDDIQKLINKENVSIYIEHSTNCDIQLECKNGVFSLNFNCYEAAIRNGKDIKNIGIKSIVTLPTDIIIKELTYLLKFIELGEVNETNIMAIEELASTTPGVQKYINI